LDQKRTILFIQDYPLSAKGGGAVIIRRLLNFSNYYGFDIVIAYDKNSYGSDSENDHHSISFDTNHRLGKFGIGRIMGSLTILGFDSKANFQLRNIVKKVKPQYIHCIAHGVSFPLAANMARKLKIPYVVSVHDIWQIVVKQYIPVKLADLIWRPILRGAVNVCVISDQMGMYLTEKYNINSYKIVHDGIDPENGKICNKRLDANKISILYAGNLFDSQKEQLLKFIDSFCDFSNGSLVIHLCSSTSLDLNKFGNKVKLYFHGWVDENQLMEISKECDYGFLPLSFSKKDALFYKTSFMTKITLYVKCNLPIICLGPAYSSAVKYISKYKLGFCIVDENKEQFIDSLKRILSLNQNEYGNIKIALEQAAKTVFLQSSIAHRFYSSFVE
jgi:glycosyltransferase involved in cell wall biosynthesis